MKIVTLEAFAIHHSFLVLDFLKYQKIWRIWRSGWILKIGCLSTENPWVIHLWVVKVSMETSMIHRFILILDLMIYQKIGKRSQYCDRSFAGVWNLWKLLKGLAVIVYFKPGFLLNAQFLSFFLSFFFLRENSTVIPYIHSNSRGNSIFVEIETFLCCWELIIAGDNLIKPVFLVKNHLNFDFLKFPYFSRWYSNTYFFLNISMFIIRETQNFILKIREIFRWRETVLRTHGMKSDEKPFFCQISVIFLFDPFGSKLIFRFHSLNFTFSNICHHHYHSMHAM